MIKKTGLIVVLLSLAVLFCTSQVYAVNGWQHWKKGEVTKEAWNEGQFSRIEIDTIPYTFMPKANIYRVTRMRNGGFNENAISRNNIYRAQHVEMLVQGFRIYQLKVMP